MNRVLCAVLAAVLFTQGCATILGGGNSQKVRFSTEPQGATVMVDGFPSGTTPCELSLNKCKSYNISFKKDGYTDASTIISNGVGAGWVVLDVCFGLVPVIVDAATSSWYYLDNSKMHAVLAAKTPVQEATK